MSEKVGFANNDIKSQTDLYSKELIFEGALRFFLHTPREIERKSFKIAKNVLSEIESWEVQYGGGKYSKIKNNAILVGYLAYKFGEIVGLEKKELSNVYIAGLVQDIGKVYMCGEDKALAYEYISSPLKKGEKGFEKIARALKRYPSETQKYLESHTNLNAYIIDTAANYHSIYSNLFNEGYPDADKEISQLDTVLWFADSLSAVSFSSINELQRNYHKNRYISLIEGFELLREQTQERIPKFWNKTSSTTLMSLVFTMIMGMASTSKVDAANYTSQQVITLTNQDRAALGLEPLKADAELMQAAMNKARDMFLKGYWDHYGPSGESPWQFIRAEGIEYSVAGENLGKGFSDVNKLNQAWLNSPAHRANIVKPEFNEVGVAVMDGTMAGENVTLVVQLFVREKTTPPPVPYVAPVKQKAVVVPVAKVAPVVNEEKIQEESLPVPEKVNSEMLGDIAKSGAVFVDFRIPLGLQKKSEAAMLNSVKDFLEKVRESLKK